MIVWLASYPRSGNTLLRTLLYQQFGLESFADESEQIAELTDAAKAMFGYKERPSDWSEAYERARHSEGITLVKTHRPPIDDSKAIYVVRDGRSTYVSYASFHQSFIKEKRLSLLALVLGMDFYGGWSEHYQLWTQTHNPLLILRYEDLVAPSQVTLEKIVDFLGLTRPEGCWKNPFIELNRENPSFFRKGDVHWKGADNWSDLIDGVFFSLHGKLMVELEYVTMVDVEQAIGRLAPESMEWLTISRQLLHDLSSYRKTCLERQVIIDGLKQACDERLDEMKRLAAELERLKQVCDERLGEVKRLAAELERLKGQSLLRRLMNSR